MNNGLGRPLTLLATPAGFGKTTLLCEWLAKCPQPAGWLSLDEQCDDLPTFVSHFVQAIRSVVRTVGAETLGLLHLSDPASPRLLAAVLDDELLDLPDDMVVVLDDYHSISDAGVHEFLSALLEYPPPGLHIALATRVDPPLPLARLRARGQLTELRAADLRFTTDETAAFFAQAAHLTLDRRAAATLEERSEGWIAGLRLAMLSLQGGERPDDVIAAFEGRRLRGVMEFLSDEVLGKQSTAVQEFLLRTSIVERLCAPLCDALLQRDGGPPPSEAMLEQVRRANLYLEPVGEDGRWYRYHHLFADVLRDRLWTQVGEDGVATLHAQAGAWFAGQGMIEEAIHHVLASGDDDRAARLVEENVHRALDREEWLALDGWLRLLPPDVVERRPALLMAKAWVAYIRNQWAVRSQLTGSVAARLSVEDATFDAGSVGAIQGELEVFRSVDCYNADNGTQAVEAAQRALTLIPDENRYVRGVALYQLARSEHLGGRGAEAKHLLENCLAERQGEVDACSLRILMALTVIRMQAGELHEAQRTATHYLRLASENGFLLSIPWPHYWLGVVSYEMNALDTAIGHFSQAIARPNQANFTAMRDSVFGLALAYQAQGREHEAAAAVARLVELLQQTTNVDQLSRVGAFEARLALLRGDVEAAVRWLNANVPVSMRLLELVENPALTRVRVLLALGTDASLDEAETLLGNLLERAQATRYVRREIEILALQALTSEARSKSTETLRALEEAVTLAAPGGFIRTFVDLGAPLADLLRRLSASSPHVSYIERVLDAFPRPATASGGSLSVIAHPAQAAPSRSQMLLDALTEREVEVLGLLQERLSNKEIAETLVISPLTVKTHASNIYGKLGVTGRRQAIRTAQALGLLAAR